MTRLEGKPTVKIEYLLWREICVLLITQVLDRTGEDSTVYSSPFAFVVGKGNVVKVLILLCCP